MSAMASQSTLCEGITGGFPSQSEYIGCFSDAYPTKMDTSPVYDNEYLTTVKPVYNDHLIGYFSRYRQVSL